MDFLTKIIAAKRERIKTAQARRPIELIRREAAETRAAATPNRLANSLTGDSKPNIIAEFKRRSPSKGEINGNADAAGMARIYEAAGAAAVSVLTEEDFFAGSLEDLRLIRDAVSPPLLRKDFLVDEYQVYESAVAGADALLLIVAALDDRTLTTLRAIAEDELGMDALVEVHTEDELKRAVDCGAHLIGVNNRNLHSFEVSIATSERLAGIAPNDVMMISESGLTPEKVRRLHELGYKGFLVGETLMRASDPAKVLHDFIEAQPAAVRVKICGITNSEDARAAIDAGADMLGFNFFRQSPRYLEPERAHAVIESARSQNGSVSMIGVFVNESIDEVIRIADELNLDGIQLHGDESAEFCEQLKKRFLDRLLIKAIAATSEFQFESLKDYQVDSIMIDAFHPHLRGGTGKLADWTLARRAASNMSGIFLAGGLSPENVADAIAKVHPVAVDACSSLESSPGKKNAARMKEFVNAVRTSKLPAEPANSGAREGN